MTGIIHLRRLAGLAACLLLVSLGAGDASAQWTNPYNGSSWNNPVSAYCDVLITHSIQRQMLKQQLAKQKPAAGGTVPSGQTPATPAPAGPRHELTDSSFTPLGGRLMPDKLAQDMAGVDAAQKQQMAALFRQALASYEEQAPKNNVAFAMGFLIGTSLQILSGTEVPDKDFEELVLGLNDALVETPKFQQMDATGRQRLYEVTVITGGLISATWQSGVDEKDPAMQAQAKVLARSVLETFGVKVN
jgi:hypothetical protein